MNTEYQLDIDNAERRIVYVRPVTVAELPEEVQSQAMGLETIYAVHDAQGERIALVKDEKLAFLLARQNNLAPVHVH